MPTLPAEPALLLPSSSPRHWGVVSSSTAEQEPEGSPALLLLPEPSPNLNHSSRRAQTHQIRAIPAPVCEGPVGGSCQPLLLAEPEILEHQRVLKTKPCPAGGPSLRATPESNPRATPQSHPTEAAPQTFPRQESWDCQKRCRRDVGNRELAGPEEAMRIRGDPGSLLCKGQQQPCQGQQLCQERRLCPTGKREGSCTAS